MNAFQVKINLKLKLWIYVPGTMEARNREISTSAQFALAHSTPPNDLFALIDIPSVHIYILLHLYIMLLLAVVANFNLFKGYIVFFIRVRNR